MSGRPPVSNVRFDDWVKVMTSNSLSVKTQCFSMLLVSNLWDNALELNTYPFSQKLTSNGFNIH